MSIVKIENGSWMNLEVEEILISLKRRGKCNREYSQSANDTVTIKAAALR